MSVGLFVDTNLLIYLHDLRFPEKRSHAAEWLRSIATFGRMVVSVQVINEFYNVMSRKFPTVTTIQARSFVESLRPSCTAPYTLQTIDRAYEVQDESGWAWYDCMIVASALQARCKYLISEDLQHERQIGGMQIIDPFQTSPKSLLPLS